MRQRHTFRVASVESLEGRQLLSAGLGSLAGFRHLINHHLFSLPGHVANRAPAGSAQRAAAGHGKIHIPENGTTGQVTPATATTAVPNIQAALNGQGPTGASASPSNGANLGSTPQNYHDLINKLGTPTNQTRGAAFPTTGTVDPTGLSKIVPQKNAPAASSTAATTDSTAATKAATNSTTLAASMMPAGGPTTAAKSTAPVGSDAVKFAQPPRWNFLNGVTLSKDDVAGLRKSVDDFAAQYTSGADATKDKAAVDALKAGLDDLSLSVWSETHVAGKDDVAKFQQSATDFAKAYTGGANLAQDKAAWKALHTALDNFAASLKAPGAAATATTTPPGSRAFPVPPMMRMDMPGPTDGLLHGPALSADEVATLKTSVDTFADNYTSGADAAKDKAASDALQSNLGDLFAGHWKGAHPQGPTAIDPVTPSWPMGPDHVLATTANDSGSATPSRTDSPIGKA